MGLRQLDQEVIEVRPPRTAFRRPNQFDNVALVDAAAGDAGYMDRDLPEISMFRCDGLERRDDPSASHDK